MEVVGLGDVFIPTSMKFNNAVTGAIAQFQQIIFGESQAASERAVSERVAQERLISNSIASVRRSQPKNAWSVEHNHEYTPLVYTYTLYVYVCSS